MANLNFKLNSNKNVEQQNDVLKSILDSQKSILDKISSLDNRISNIEKTATNHSFHCSASDLHDIVEEKANEISTAISNIKLEPNTVSYPDSDTLEKVNTKISRSFEQLKSHTTKLVVGATLFITCWLAAFVWWFWDVPAQTQAVNNYAYQQTHKGDSSQNSQ